MSGNATPAYWDAVASRGTGAAPGATWRAYMQGVYRELMARWFDGAPVGRCLKTDLFEEAVTPFHPFAGSDTALFGIDLSPQVVRAAARRLAVDGGTLAAVAVADLRGLPLADGAFARILSGSSLDHFRTTAELNAGLTELARVLRPGGCLIVTFDNPGNPLVRLRNLLPFALLSAVGLVPYFVGATYSRRQATAALTKLGLEVTHTDAVVHVPRAPAIWISTMATRRRGAQVAPWLLTALRWFDRRLSRSPTRYLTGYYVAIRAHKPCAGDAS